MIKEIIKYLDEALCNFIKYLMIEFPFHSTIILVSEHINNMRGFFWINKGEDYYIEKGLPNFYLILEDKNNYNHTVI